MPIDFQTQLPSESTGAAQANSLLFYVNIRRRTWCVVLPPSITETLESVITDRTDRLPSTDAGDRVEPALPADSFSGELVPSITDTVGTFASISARGPLGELATGDWRLGDESLCIDTLSGLPKNCLEGDLSFPSDIAPSRARAC